MYIYVVSCPLLTDPYNGVVICSLGDDNVPLYEDTCNYTCNTGYVLTASSDTRTCQSDGSWSDGSWSKGNWSGSDEVCRRGMFLLDLDIWYSILIMCSILLLSFKGFLLISLLQALYSL